MAVLVRSSKRRACFKADVGRDEKLLKRFLPNQGMNREEQEAGRGRGKSIIPAAWLGRKVLSRGPSGVSYLTPSSPCQSLDPSRAGGDRAYRGEHLWGVAGSELEGLFKLLLGSRS